MVNFNPLSIPVDTLPKPPKLNLFKKALVELLGISCGSDLVVLEDEVALIFFSDFFFLLKNDVDPEVGVGKA